MLTRSLRRRAAKAVQQSVDLDVAWQEWQVAEAAKLAVYRISALDPQVDFANEAVGALEEMRHAIEKAAARGEMSQSDVASIRIALEAGRRNSLSLRQSRDRERQTLNSLLGLPPHEQVALRNPSGKAPKRRLWDDLPSEQLLVQDLDQRLDLVALQKGYESQDARVRLAIWSQFPSIGLSLSRSRDTFNLQTRGFGVAVRACCITSNRTSKHT
jgi:outer membrane protein TolC